MQNPLFMDGVNSLSTHPQSGRKSPAELITETLCSTRPTIRIGGEDIPAEQVKSRFLTLDCEHINYVFESMARNSTDIRNIRAYLLTALYHATITINNNYQAAVRRDWINYWSEETMLNFLLLCT